MAQPFPAAVQDHSGLYTGTINTSRSVESGALPPPVANPPAAPVSAPLSHERRHAAEAVVPTSEPKRVAMLSNGESHHHRQVLHAAPAGSYVVQSGDTLTNIASRTGVSIDALKAANGLSGSTIRIGQRLMLPAGATPVKPAPQVAKAVAAPKAATPKPEPRKVAELKPQPKPAPAVQTRAEPQPKSYTPPVQPKETVTQAESGKKLASLAPETTGIGKLRWPVHGQIVSKFGSQDDGHRNDGIDILVPEGTPVKAAENGVVIYAGNGLKEYGNTVLVRHDNGLVTVYGFAKDLKVGRGDKVTRGEIIADSGMSGSASRPKLHFEVRKDATPVNPLSYLD